VAALAEAVLPATMASIATGRRARRRNDLDHFKLINDRFGVGLSGVEALHSADQALCVARADGRNRLQLHV
jgi:hypothetical protein